MRTTMARLPAVFNTKFNIITMLIFALAVLCQVHPIWTYSLHKQPSWNKEDIKLDDVTTPKDSYTDDVMVSDMTWHDDILTEDTLTDGWNGVPLGCGGKPAEVFLVMDSSFDPSSQSSSSYYKLFEQQKNYVSDLLALFTIRKSATRVGILSFGQTVELLAPLNAELPLPELRNIIEKAPHVGGRRHTAEMLKYLRLEGFSPLAARREVAHVVILITSGEPVDLKQAVQEADLLKKQGVYVYVVSAPFSSLSQDYERDLDEISSSPSDEFVFSTSDWTIVDSLITLLHIKECNYQVLPPLSGKEAVCSSRRPTEIVFALDHLSLGGSKTMLVLSSIQNMLAEIDPSSDIKAAILTSRDPVSRGSLSRQVETIESVERKLGGVVFPDMAQLLKQARRTLNKGAQRAFDYTAEVSDSELRPEDVQKVLVVFVDNSIEPTKASLAAAAAKNRRHKIDTYVIYVAEDTESDQAKAAQELVAQLASGDDHVIRVKGYGDLQDESTVLATLAAVCRGL